VRRNRLLALAILAILALAALAPAGQASDSAERAQQRALLVARHAAERESLRQQRQATRDARKEQSRAARELAKQESQSVVTAESEHAVATFKCNEIDVQYRGLPSVENSPNVVSQRVLFRQGLGPLPSYVFPAEEVSFQGETGTATIPIAAPLGTSTVALRSRYESNGVRGGIHLHARLTCGPIPQFVLSTQQSIGGASAPTLPGVVGQTVAYETLATNTGNTALTFSGFSDPGCDDMTPVADSKPIKPHDSATYLCTHTLDEADLQATLFANAASVTGIPGPKQGGPATVTSKGVLISPITPGEAKQPTGGPTPGSKEVTTASVPATPKSGVASFTAAHAVPALLGPARCVRGPFTTSVKSPGVANVTFYIDGRRIARRTVHSAKSGLISVRFNGAKLKPGRHRLKASITMTPVSPTIKAVSAWRGRIVRRCAAGH
jgi:Tfp pilus assembly protein PilE